MEIRLLRYFWTVAQEENISKAARILNITQPTLSRQIKELEVSLGVALFHRKRNQLMLTKDGLFLKERAAELLALDDKLEQAFFEHTHKQLQGLISIGCVEADNSDTVAMMLEELISDFPQIRFNLVTATSEDISDRLEKGLLDLALLLKPVSLKGVESLPLPRKERWGFLLSKEMFLAQNRVIEPKDLYGLPILCSSRPEVQALLSNWSGIALNQLTIVGYYNLLFNVQSLVKNNVGAALVIEGAITNRETDDVIFLPLSPEIKSTCILVWKNKVQSPAVQELIQRFKNAFSL